MNSRLPFIDRDPTTAEVEWLRAAISTFADGSGDPAKHGDTIPNWRDYERILAIFYGGHGPEDKQVFDVFLPASAAGGGEAWVGLSVKSKCLGGPRKIEALDGSGRTYMELANSPQKIWDGLAAADIRPEDWGDPERAAALGDGVLGVVEGWHRDAHERFVPPVYAGAPRLIDLKQSAYLTVSYSTPSATSGRLFQLHSFPMTLKRPAAWHYRAQRYGQVKSIRGVDSDGKSLWDWYAHSGGQLKYYPTAASARYRSPIFTLLETAKAFGLEEKMAAYYPGMAGVWRKP